MHFICNNAYIYNVNNVNGLCIRKKYLSLVISIETPTLSVDIVDKAYMLIHSIAIKFSC